MDCRYFVSSKEMKRYDAATINYFGVPSMVLMERAALGAAEEIEKRFKPGSSVLVAAGGGNNGGDGIAIGRILKLHGYEVDVVLPDNRSKCSEETQRQLCIVQKYGCPVQGKIENREYDIVVDALFGIGLSRDIEGYYAECIEKINSLHTFVCAVDIPSGIDADTGRIMKTAVKASITVTFAFEKPGHILYPGCEYAGEIICKDIGITKESFLQKEPEIYSYKQKIAELMPSRRKGGNKGNFGKVLVIAGSINMSGACELCARSVYRIGAGMVKIVTPEENRAIVQGNIPEALLTTYPSCTEIKEETDKLAEELTADMDWADCIIIGPGMGKSKLAGMILKQVITESEKPLIIDADGLNLLSESEDLMKYFADKTNDSERDKPKRGDRQVIMTPHIAEFARIYNCTPEEAKSDILHKPKELADMLRCVVVCKDARTVVASYGEDSIYLNTTGNDGMATAGSGDVLAGIIGGLLAQGLPAKKAAAAGVYIHGILGDEAARRNGKYAVMAGDLAEQLKYISADEGTGNGNGY